MLFLRRIWDELEQSRSPSEHPTPLGSLLEVSSTLIFSSEGAMIYLLSRKVDVNAQDSQGATPLHMAIKSAFEENTTRVVRCLLLSGAKPDLKNSFDKTPLDLANEKAVASTSLLHQLRSLLVSSISQSQQTRKLDCLLLKSPVRPTTQNPSTMVLYIFLFIMTNLALFFFVFPTMD